MSPETVASLWTQAMYLIVTMVLVIILPSLFVGLIVSTFQAATQINEQTLSFLPRLLTTLFSIILMGPWLLKNILEFTEQLIRSIPYVIF
ncbi:MAG: flagellar biosynthetic protein FliQ [SAR86 cluster bacterium]|uniref:Flagellar biosynthetic protein FliQ n=1 Tax=SAR86 cluster bacterium TaxID=2030880 RepID=A0A2A4MJS5_9GAMM|nr:MAG: flagellar biosynthetic protein FliQ [SAR86 cluster bacterium]